MSVPAPNPEECQGLQFKTLCRLRVFAGQPDDFKSSANLVAVAPLYGLIFVGTPNGFQVLLSSKVAEIHAPRGETLEYPRREVSLGCAPSHLSVSCDQVLLVVAFVKDGCPSAILYDMSSFCSRNLKVVVSIRLASSPGSKVLDLQFNPGLPQFLAACTSDGGVGVYELKGGSFSVSTLPPATHATCLCWSPKGKQLVIGDSKGNIAQYKPDLKLVKSFPPPPDKPSSAIVNLLWISNYQFAAVYADTTNPSERPGIMIVNVPKMGTSYINYEDICYSAGELRSPQFYMALLAKWNILMVASANSIEVGVLALAPDGCTWLQWTQEDAARAELPLTPLKQETYPVGIAIDTSSTYQIPWGENESLHPMPMLHILSHDGVLCIFHVINIRPEAVCACEPPRPLPDLSGLDQFVAGPPPQQVQSSVPAPQTQQPPPLSLSQPSSQLFQPSLPSQPTQSSQLSTSFSQTASIQTPQAVQQVPALAPNPLQQLSSMGNQLQQMSQPSKPTGFGSLGISGIGTGATQSQSPFSSSSAVASLPQGSSLSFTQSIATSVASGASISKAPTSAFNVPSSLSSQLSTPVPSYSVPTATTAQASMPEVAQRPAVVVPVPAVQSSQANSTAPRSKETEPANVETPEDKVEVVDPAVYAELIQEEIQVFENELNKLKHLVTQELPPIGSEEDKKKLIKSSQELDSAIMELNKSVEDLKHDVYEVKAVEAEASVWVEDAKSRLRQFNKPSYLQLVKAQELDPVSSRTLFNIQQKFNYLEIQLGNINKQLSLEWGQYQDTRSPRNRLFVPTMDEVYQTMVRQNSIINKLKIILEDVSQRIAARKLKNSNRIPLISDTALARKPPSRRLQLHDDDSSFKSETDLSSLAENLLESQLKKQQLDDTDLEALASRALNLNTKKPLTIIASQKRLSAKKEDILRERLLQIHMARVKANRTPSELGSVGNRPCVSFSSSVLSLSPRKPLSSKRGKEPVPVASTPLKPVSTTAPPSSTIYSTSTKTAPQPATPFMPSGSTLFSQNSKPAAFSASSGFSISTPPLSFTGQPKPSGSAADTPTPKAVASPTASVSAGGSLKQGAAPSIKAAVPSAAPAVSTTPASSVSTTAGLLSSGFKFSSSVSGLSDSASPSAVNLAKSGSVVTFGQPSSNQPFAFGGSAPSITAGSSAPKSPLFATPSKASSPLGAMSDMVNKAGPAITSTPKAFGGDAKQAPPAKTAFSFASVLKPSPTAAPSQSAAASPTATPPPAVTSPPFASPAVASPRPTSTSSSPVIVVASPPSTGASKAGLLPTPTTAQSLFGGSLTITPVPPVTASSSATAVTATSSTPAVADSTTPFLGGLGLGGPPSATNKSAAAIFGGAVSTFQASKGTSLFAGAPLDFSASSGGAGAASPFAPPSSPATPAPAAAAGSGTAFGFGSLASSLTAAPAAAVSTAATASATAAVAAAPTTAAGTSLLGQPPSSAPATTTLFGAPAASGTTSLFSQPASTATTPALGQSLFGTPAAAPAAVSSAAPSPALAAAAQVVAAAAATATATTGASSIFGGTPAAASSAASIFGGAPAAAASSAASSTTGSIFGGVAAPRPAAGSAATAAGAAAATATSTGAASLFGGAAAVSSSPGFSFALPSISATAAPSSTTSTATTGAAASPFSFALPASTATATSSAPSAFGASGGSLFGQASTAATTAAASPATSQASFFGQAVCSPSAGSGGSIFGGGSAAAPGAAPGAAPQSIFGQSAAQGASAFGAKATFGQSGGSLFGGGSGFGSSGSVFGGSGSSSIFGGAAAATSPSSGNLFQQGAASGGSLFGQTPSSPSTGAFSGALGGTIEQAGFGTPNSFQSRPSGGGFGGFQNNAGSGSFGSAPAFGSPPAFGGSPAFGAAPAFGGAPAFGSPSRVFGAAPATTGFGSTSPSQTNSTFEALATQDAGPSFGNLAQGGPQSPQATNLFGSPAPATPFSNTGSSSFGGTSFSSWR